MVFQKMHFVVQKSASPLSKKCDKLNRLGVDNWTLTMIDETGQDALPSLSTSSSTMTAELPS
jgi:hypothetical protein